VVSRLLSQPAVPRGGIEGARSVPLFACKLLLKSHLAKLNLHPVNGVKSKNGGGNASWPARANLSAAESGICESSKKQTLSIVVDKIAENDFSGKILPEEK